MVTLSLPTSEAGDRFPAQPQVGKLVVAYKIFTFGSEWYFQIKNDLNRFWGSVFKYWFDIEKSHQLITNEDILNNSPWYNSKLGTEDICFQDWPKKI